MSRPIIARGLLGLCILHGCPTMAVTIRGEDHLLVLLKKRFFSFEFVTQRWVLLRTLERILCFEVTVQSVVKVLHVCHHVQRHVCTVGARAEKLLDLFIYVLVCPLVVHDLILPFKGVLGPEIFSEADPVESMHFKHVLWRDCSVFKHEVVPLAESELVIKEPQVVDLSEYMDVNESML